MKSVVLILALGASCVVGDYIASTIYPFSETCDGTPFAESFSSFGCTSSGDSSYQIMCNSGSNATYNSYMTADCSGTPFSFDAPYTFGCSPSDGSNSSFSTSCMTGDLVLPIPAVNVKIYDMSETACPPSDPAAFLALTSYPCGVCQPISDTEAFTYDCDATAWLGNYFMDPVCSGAPFYTYDMAPLGCDDTDGTVQVTQCSKAAKEAADRELAASTGAVAAAAKKAPPAPAAVVAKIRAFVAKADAKVEAAEAARTGAVLAAIKARQGL